MSKFYCNQKFTRASVSLSDGEIQSCCAAEVDAVSLSELKSTDLGYFNYNKIVEDRQKMLAGKKLPGCSSCWKLEDRGLDSRRTLDPDRRFIDTVRNNHVEFLNVVLTNTCKMTCVYCCKKFSHSWRADLVNNGEYTGIADTADSDRYKVGAKDQLLHKLSQNKLQRSPYYDVLIEQLKQSREHIKHLTISGGEPFISNNLFEVTGLVDYSTKLVIYSGLGVSQTRLANILDKLKEFEQIIVCVSAENVNELYEFNRYGNSFENFEANLKFLESTPNVTVRFATTISNLTLIGFADFLNKYPHIEIEPTVLTTPSFLRPHVLDKQTKEHILKSLESLTFTNKENILESIQLNVIDNDRLQAGKFISEFAKRRNLNLDIFPKEFVKWLNSNNAGVAQW